MTSTDTARLPKKLEEQVQFIRRSCNAYDQGAEEEALRIATSLRVIFHQTGASTSLITNLGASFESACERPNKWRTRAAGAGRLRAKG